MIESRRTTTDEARRVCRSTTTWRLASVLFWLIITNVASAASFQDVITQTEMVMPEYPL